MHLFSKVLTRVLVLVDFLKIGQHEVYSLDSRREALFSGMAGRHGRQAWPVLHNRNLKT